MFVKCFFTRDLRQTKCASFATQTPAISHSIRMAIKRPFILPLKYVNHTTLLYEFSAYEMNT